MKRLGLMNKKKHSKFSCFEQYYEKNKEIITKNAMKYQQFKECECVEKKVQIAVESTISLIINEKYRINILCTCQQIEELIVGYLICEGLISSFSDIDNIEYRGDDKVYISVNNSFDDFINWLEIRTSGCIGIKQQYEKMNINIESDLKTTPKAIFKSLNEMNHLSKIWKISGGAHMSGLFYPDGTIAYYSEDVGRHNTLDKIIGGAVINGNDLSNLFVATSGRISAAMVTKIARAGIPLIASISAPTAQGLDIAEKTQITIVGFSREPKLNIYTHSKRILI